jgi:hypothetical protein
MIDPCYSFDLYKNSNPVRLPRLQHWLSIAESGYSPESHITMPEDLFTVICTSSMCFLSSYEHGVQKLFDLACGKEFVSASFDESITITFYHKTKGSITYCIAPDFFDKIRKKEFYIQKKAGIPVNDIPATYAIDVLKTVFNYDDSSIFLLDPVPDFDTNKVIKKLINAELEKKR